MKVFDPLPVDHWLITDSVRCVLCTHKFIANDHTTLLFAPPSDKEDERTTALPAHAACVTMAMHGHMEPPSHELTLEDPALPPEQRALQQRYSSAITTLMVDLMKPEESGSCVAMINALFAHALIGLQVLNRAGIVKPGALDRVLERLKLALESPPPREYTIQLMELADGTKDEHEGQWVVDFYPGPPGSRGTVKTTKNEIAEAKRFRTHGEAGEFWRQQNGVRADGKPNRPLTAWTAIIEPIGENGDVGIIDVDGVRSPEGLS